MELLLISLLLYGINFVSSVAKHYCQYPVLHFPVTLCAMRVMPSCVLELLTGRKLWPQYVLV